ncbi:MAG TPA: DUF2585 family protein [Verrucomicrobiae bacterium]|nr:DUF2585 family protein [Verrucomicrobiae bacterium]
MTLKKWVLVSLLVIVVSGLVLFAMDRLPFCKCGYIKIWHGVVFSSENSQHMTDWYTPSHVIHGFAFYLLLWLIGKKYKWSIGFKLFLAVLIESAWEVFENTDLVINHYRSVTISLDYYGDTILNSIMDILAMIAGFVIAYRFPVWVTVLLTIFLEAVVAYYIRDNLLLNIIMLIYPNEVFLKWQQGG